MEGIFDGSSWDDQHVTWRNHIKATTKSCYSILKSLRMFKLSADFKLRRSLAHSLILSRINYCNAILSDAPTYLFKKLQKIQNAAARFVYGRKVDENDVIRLKWSQVRERISLSFAKLTHKALHDPSWPSYLTVRRPTPRGRDLRSLIIHYWYASHVFTFFFLYNGSILVHTTIMSIHMLIVC